MKEKIKEFNYWCGDKLRTWCGEITPDKRLLIILIILLIGTVANLYLSFSCIYNLGQKNAKKDFMELQHIEGLELEKSQNHLNKEEKEEYEYND